MLNDDIHHHREYHHVEENHNKDWSKEGIEEHINVADETAIEEQMLIVR